MESFKIFLGLSDETFKSHLPSLGVVIEESCLILLLGAFAGFLASVLLQVVVTIGSVILRCFHCFTVHCILPFYTTIALIGDLWPALVFPSSWTLCGWKISRTAMPRRRRRRGSLSTEPQQTTLQSYRLLNEDVFNAEDNIEFFEKRIAGDDDDGTNWKPILRKNLREYLQYDAQMRILQGNKTEYKSTSILRDATAEELTAFYLDDECRRTWDKLLAKCESIESGSRKDRCEVVRWIRSFPFPFLSDREYVIGRKIFKRDDVIYTVTRGVNHVNVPITSSVVRMDVYYSIWSCRNIPCPWGSEKTACEVILLHHEQFKIPEKLARFAAVRGMWGFVKNMGPAMITYVKDYRNAKALEAEKAMNQFDPNANSLLALSREARMIGCDSEPVQGKSKVMKTFKRALIATVVGTTVILVKRMNQKEKSS
eukprot:g6967.t1